MLRFFRIADNTFKESIREPVYFLMLLCALVLIAHFPSMALFVFFEQLKLVVDSSMATSLFFGLLCAVLCASNTVSRELRNGSVLLLLSKPVPRALFILAKIAGIVAAAALTTAVEYFEHLVADVDQYWKKHPRAVIWTPDHGNHAINDSQSAHGKNIPEDMLVDHYYRLRAAGE